MEASTSTLSNLPTELVLRILEYLSFTDLASCKRTNRLLHDLIESDLSLQYSIELQVAAYRDNPSSASLLPLEDRLRLLREREQAWDDLDFSQSAVINVGHVPSGIYDLTGGIFILGESLSDSPFRAETIALQYSWLSSAINASGPPPTNDGTNPVWSRIDLQANVIDVGLASREHDLIAAVTYTLHHDLRPLPAAAIDIYLLKLSTGQPHPAALNPIIHVTDTHFKREQTSLSLEIVGDTLGILLTLRNRDSVIFHIYNWKTGQQTFFRRAESTRYTSFCFLSSEIIVLPNLKDDTFELCCVAETNTSADVTDRESSPLKTICSLSLPTLARGCFLFGIWCRGEPNPFGSTDGITNRSGVPFQYDPQESILMFSIQAVNAVSGSAYSYILMVHRSSLLDQISQQTTRVYSESNGTDEHQEEVLDDIPWATWGPSVCRWLHTNDRSNRWITTTCGQRYATINLDLPSPLTIYNFNQTAIRRFAHKKGHSLPRGDAEISIPPSSEVQGHVRYNFASEELLDSPFQESVVSRLPFMSITTLELFDYEGVLVDDGVLIGIRFKDDDIAEDISELVLHLMGPQTNP